MSDKKTALVISAHAADFVWRCGGAIALHAELGYNVTVVCLSFGERGESAKLWKQGDMDLQTVKDARRAEAEAAGKALGVHDLISMDLGDYPLELTRENKNDLVDIIRKVQTRLDRVTPGFEVKFLYIWDVGELESEDYFFRLVRKSELCKIAAFAQKR